MHPDLALLVDLQRIDSAISACRKGLADVPSREAALDARLAAATGARDAAKQQVTDNRTARGAVERDLAVVQGRLSRFKDQTMAVKTNKEFHALQHEIAVAQQEIRGFEDRLLDFMMLADEYAAAVKSAEAGLAAVKRASEEERAQITAEHARLEAELAARVTERDVAAGKVSKHSLALYDSVHRSRGVAVAEMREGRCSVCQVRLRPQVAQVIRRNDSVVQCDSCGRILYYGAPPTAPPTAPADTDTPPSAPA
jgi:hypothetical protein